MRKNQKKELRLRIQKIGLPPGSLPPDENLVNSGICMIQYNQDTVNEKNFNHFPPVTPDQDTHLRTWINIDSIQDTSIVEEAGSQFLLHPLMLEDIVTPDQRPKTDEYSNYQFLTLRMLKYDPKQDELDSEQISLVLGKNYLITFQEKPGDVFANTRDRLRNAKGKIRSLGTDYLMYTLIDNIVDHYFLILESIGEKIDDLEVELIQDPKKQHLERLYKLKNQALYLKKSVWPLREVINKMIRDENPMICQETRLFFKDIYDHCIQVIETIESYRDLLAAMMDLYLSSISNRLNEVMKVLTSIATIFIPLTFLTGIYGMNFEYMPELHFKYSYPILLFVMFAIIGFQVYYFRKKKWL